MWQQCQYVFQAHDKSYDYKESIILDTM